MMWGYCWSLMSGWGALLWLLPLGVVVLLGWAISRSEHWREHRSSIANRGPESEDSAFAIIRQRFAKGEISADEYERLQTLLSK